MKGVVMSKRPLEENKIQGGGGFSLAECVGFSLAGLLLGTEKNLPLLLR